MRGNVGDFVGVWPITWVTGSKPFLQQTYQLLIGTGTAGDTPPYVNRDFDVAVGFAVLDLSGNPVLSSATPYEPPLELLYVGGSLRWAGPYDDPASPGNPQPLRIYISAAEALTLQGPSVSLYGTTLWKDPDQIGVWGAEGTPHPKANG